MIAWIPFLPLIGFAVNGFWYLFGQSGPGQTKAKAQIPGIIASVSIGLAFIVSLVAFIDLVGRPADDRVLEQILFSWMRIGDFNIDLGFRMDVLSALFCLVITGVGTLIHVYSIGYMGDDESPGKYFCYLNLFCFSMLVLVLGSTLPLLFLGWEGVGLCSYLLIGYWYTDNEKASAGKKAFIANRVGDLGFLLGMFLIFTTFGTLDFAELASIFASGSHQALEPAHASTLTVICLLLFVGCAGKSAQIPLYVWLPDAMAGPTPVSALIHAATMVTSGIYLIARLNFVYTLSPTALMVVAWVGVLTALFAASMAIAQDDIKKVLAYSTISQLGYMFLACGVGAYGAGVFHVITHAFFKALMFLGAGSVIHGMHHNQDMLKMGNLKQHMPWTYRTFLCGWLAICGVVGFSGFFSKDEVLWKAFSSPFGSKGLWLVGLITAIFTAIYMTRLFSLTFLGKERFDPKAVGVHESPKVMTVPLMVLAVLSVLGGFIGIPHLSALQGWLEPVIPSEVSNSGMAFSTELILMFIGGVVLAPGAMFFTLKFYRDLDQVEKFKQSWIKFYTLLQNKWYVDEFYEFILIRPIQRLSKLVWQVLDVGIIDQIVNGLGRVTQVSGQAIRVFQTGSIQVYVIVFLTGLAVTLGYIYYAAV